MSTEMCTYDWVLEIRRERAGGGEAVVSELVVRENVQRVSLLFRHLIGRVAFWSGVRWCSFLSLFIMGE